MRCLTDYQQSNLNWPSQSAPRLSWKTQINLNFSRSIRYTPIVKLNLSKKLNYFQDKPLFPYEFLAILTNVLIICANLTIDFVCYSDECFILFCVISVCGIFRDNFDLGLYEYLNTVANAIIDSWVHYNFLLLFNTLAQTCFAFIWNT